MLRSIRVADYMARDLATLSPEMSIEQAIGVLLDRRISGAPVVEDGQLVGMFSEVDCLRELLHAGYHDMSSGQVLNFMSTEIETIGADESIVTVAEIFLNKKRRRLPVIDAAGALVGQISRRDVLRAISDIRSGKHPAA